MIIFSATWIASACVLWVIAVILVAGVLERRAHRVQRLASEEVAAGAEVSTVASRLAR